MLALSINLTIVKPRIATTQRHRANAEQVSQTPSDYYRINVYYLFIDHVVEQLDTQFSEEHMEIIAAESLIPLNIANLSENKILLVMGNLCPLKRRLAFLLK